MVQWFHIKIWLLIPLDLLYPTYKYIYLHVLDPHPRNTHGFFPSVQFRCCTSLMLLLMGKSAHSDIYLGKPSKAIRWEAKGRDQDELLAT